MRIFVVGNINSGKSYTVSKLKNIFSEYPVISIDQYRRNFSDGTIEKELLTREKFSNDIIFNKDAIIEYSGGKVITDMFIDKLDKNSFIVLEVEEDVNLCLERIKDKDFTKTPYPKFQESLEDAIVRLDKEYKSGCIENNFKDKYIQKYIINSGQDLNNLPLLHYDLVNKIVDITCKTGDYLISYGSLGRGMLTKYSDLDIYLITTRSINQIEELIKISFPYSRIIIQKNQICLYYNDILLELVVVKSIDEVKHFYSTGKIQNAEKTLLFGSKDIVDELNQFKKNEDYNFIEDLNYTINRLDYYCESLKRIEKTKDEYKYYFHNNIVIHEYLRLKYFINGGRDFNYLPKNGLDIISREDFEKISYTLNTDKLKHYNLVRELTDILVKKAEKYKENI